MNERSLSHNLVQNQQSSSWIDDPFQLGMHAFKGLKPMSKQRNLDDFIQKMISQHGKYGTNHYDLNLDTLPHEDQDELVRLHIESIDREIEWACYGSDESINSDFLCAMLDMLQCNSQEAREKFAETTRRNLFTYYKKTLQSLFEGGCIAYLQNQMNEEDYQVDHDNGDVVWGKFK